MPNVSPLKRRTAALHLYAALCALTGISGVILSLWAHPVPQAARLAQAAQLHAAQTLPGKPAPEFAQPLLIRAGTL